MYTRRRVQTIKTGNPVADGTQVEMRLHATDAIFDTTETQDGWFSFQTNGNPGPHYFRVIYDEETHIASSQATGVSGVVDIANLPLFIRAFRSGYIPGVLGGLQVSAAGTVLGVTVASGAGYYRGILYDQASPFAMTVEAADTQPRIDLLVVEVVPQGAGANIEGRSRLRIKKGVPASSPVAPGLTQTWQLWEEPLAEIRVDANVTVIASNKVTDRREAFTPIIQPASITREMLASDATPGVMVSRGGNAIVPHARNLNFASADFLVSGVHEGDYSQDSRPSVDIGLDRDGLLEWLEENLDLGQPVENPTYTVRSNDKNFNASGSWSGGWGVLPGATVKISLPSGAWLIESVLNMSIRGTGAGAQCTIRLVGDGTPQGSNQSMRIFAVSSGTTRQVVLTGRHNVSHSGTKEYTVTVERTHQSGAAVDFRDGVVYVKAYRV